MALMSGVRSLGSMSHVSAISCAWLAISDGST